MYFSHFHSIHGKITYYQVSLYPQIDIQQYTARNSLFKFIHCWIQWTKLNKLFYWFHCGTTTLYTSIPKLWNKTPKLIFEQVSHGFLYYLTLNNNLNSFSCVQNYFVPHSITLTGWKLMSNCDKLLQVHRLCLSAGKLFSFPFTCRCLGGGGGE